MVNLKNLLMVLSMEEKQENISFFILKYVVILKYLSFSSSSADEYILFHESNRKYWYLPINVP